MVVVFAASMRAYWSYYVTEKTYDVTWMGFHLWIWTAVEANLGVICGSIPALRPLFKAIFRSKNSSYYNSASHVQPSGTTSRVVITATRKSGRNWTDTLQRGSKGMRIQDDHIDVEVSFGVSRRNKDLDSPVSTLEMDSWPPREHQLPKTWPDC